MFKYLQSFGRYLMTFSFKYKFNDRTKTIKDFFFFNLSIKSSFYVPI